jgi:ribonuclease P protein component
MRAAVRELSPLPAGMSLVFIAKRAAAEAEFQTIKQEMAELIGRLRSAK